MSWAFGKGESLSVARVSPCCFRQEDVQGDPGIKYRVKSRCDFKPPGVPCTTHSSVSWAPGQCVCEKRFVVERCCICQLCTQHQFMSNVVDHWSHGIRGEHIAPDDSCGRFAWNEYFGVRAHLHQKVLAGLFVVEVRWSEKTFPAMIHNASLALLISARCTSAKPTNRTVCGGNECDCADALAAEAPTVDRVARPRNS